MMQSFSPQFFFSFPLSLSSSRCVCSCPPPEFLFSLFSAEAKVHTSSGRAAQVLLELVEHTANPNLYRHVVHTRVSSCRSDCTSVLFSITLTAYCQRGQSRASSRRRHRGALAQHPQKRGCTHRLQTFSRRPYFDRSPKVRTASPPKPFRNSLTRISMVTLPWSDVLLLIDRSPKGHAEIHQSPLSKSFT